MLLLPSKVSYVSVNCISALHRMQLLGQQANTCYDMNVHRITNKLTPCCKVESGLDLYTQFVLISCCCGTHAAVLRSHWSWKSKTSSWHPSISSLRRVCMWTTYKGFIFLRILCAHIIQSLVLWKPSVHAFYASSECSCFQGCPSVFPSVRPSVLFL